MGVINDLRDEVYENAKKHGFYDDEENKNVLLKLMLIVSEISEAAEAYRNKKYSHIPSYIEAVNYYSVDSPDQIHQDSLFEKYIKDHFEDEISDAIIRCLDLCGFMGIDIEKHIELKMKYNKNRPYKHGKIC